MRKTSFLIATLFLLTVAAWLALGVMYLKDKALTGRVVDSITGRPLPGIALRLGPWVTITDAEGQFALTGLRGPQRLAAQADGYYPQVMPVTWAWWQRQSTAEVRLQPTNLAGAVVDAWSGQPLAGIAVEAHGVASAPTQASVTTDATGHFSLPHLVPPLEITVHVPGYLEWHSVITGYEVLATGAEWQVALLPNTVSGSVQAADTGEPLSGVTVSLGEQAVTSDDRGLFQLHRVAPGATVQISPPDQFLPAQVTYSGEGELAIAVEPRLLVVSPHDAWAGMPLPGTLVTGAEISRTAGADGARFTRITPGTALRLTRDGYVTAEVTYQGEPELQVAMHPVAWQGVIRDTDTGQPVPGAILYLGEQILEADDAGSYRIPELGDVSAITVKAPGFRKATLSLAAGTTALPSLDVEPMPCAQAPEPPGPPCLDLGLTPFDARAIYIPYGLLAQPDSVFALLDLIDRTELNAFVVDVKGDRGYLAYDSQVPLAAELGLSGEQEGWLTLDELLAEAQARGIYAIARIVVFKDNPLAFGRPELAAQRADGTVWTDGEGLGWGNPFREEVWNYNIAIAQEVAAMGFDEVQFDYLRFPSDGDIGAITYAQENTAETRTAAIREFTRRMAQALRPYGVFTSADVFGLTVWVEPESDMSIGQRVIDVAPSVDYLCPMVYPSTFVPGNLGYDDPAAYPYEVIYRSQQAAQAAVPAPTRVRPWLQAYWYTPWEMLLQKQAAEDADSTGWSFWNAGGVYDEALFEGYGGQ